MSKDVLKLALEFVNDIRRGKYKGDAEEISTAIKQALEQPVQEPVEIDADMRNVLHGALKRSGKIIPPPAAPVQPVAMRMPKVGDRVVCIDDESLGTVVYLTAGGSPEIKFDDGSHGTYMLREFADLFGYTTPTAQPAPVQDASKQFHEWAVAEHAAQPAPVQEPVATGDTLFRQFMSEAEKAGVTHWPTPPAAQRPWVGLTDEERKKIKHEHYARTLPLMEAVEAKLHEKNT